MFISFCSIVCGLLLCCCLMFGVLRCVGCLFFHSSVFVVVGCVPFEFYVDCVCSFLGVSFLMVCACVCVLCFRCGLLCVLFALLVCLFVWLLRLVVLVLGGSGLVFVSFCSIACWLLLFCVCCLYVQTRVARVSIFCICCFLDVVYFVVVLIVIAPFLCSF